MIAFYENFLFGFSYLYLSLSSWCCAYLNIDFWKILGNTDCIISLDVLGRLWSAEN